MSITVTSIKNAFPLDSAPPKFVDGRPVYDRSYNASDLRTFVSLAVTDGVWVNYRDELTPTLEGGSWRLSPGAAVAGGLLITLDESCHLVDQADIATGQYAYVCVAARLDSTLNDGGIYARLSSSPAEQPIRTESTHELILARIDWRGTMTDLRMDNAMCGPVTPVMQPDTDSFMAALHTAVDQFNLNVGTVTSLPSGSTPTVTVRKPVEAGGDVYIDFGIPRGPKGDPGQSAPGVYLQEERPESPSEGTLWLGSDPDTRQIEHIEVYEVTGTYPGETYPGEKYPGGSAAWAAYTIDPALVTSAQS